MVSTAPVGQHAYYRHSCCTPPPQVCDDGVNGTRNTVLGSMASFPAPHLSWSAMMVPTALTSQHVDHRQMAGLIELSPTSAPPVQTVGSDAENAFQSGSTFYYAARVPHPPTAEHGRPRPRRHTQPGGIRHAVARAPSELTGGLLVGLLERTFPLPSYLLCRIVGRAIMETQVTCVLVLAVRPGVTSAVNPIPTTAEREWQIDPGHKSASTWLGSRSADSRRS